METMRICGCEEWKKLFPIFEKRPLLVLLSGPMGAGKTTLVREYLEFLGFKGRVKSPTFTYEIVYEGMKVSHIDLYRLSGQETDIVDEIVDRLEEGYVVFIEWPERLENQLKMLKSMYEWVDVHIEIESSECRAVSIGRK